MALVAYVMARVAYVMVWVCDCTMTNCLNECRSLRRNPHSYRMDGCQSHCSSRIECSILYMEHSPFIADDSYVCALLIATKELSPVNIIIC